MKPSRIAAAAILGLLLVPPLVGQTSQPASRPRREPRPPPTYSGPELAGSAEFGDVESKLLNQKVHYAAYLPPGYKDSANAKTRYPVVMFLHGLFESPERWMNQRHGPAIFDTAIREKKIPPVIVVMPNAGYSFYSDTLDGKKPYARFFIEEFVPWIDKTYRTTGNREERMIGGASMGGYGALRFAFKHPELFSAVFVHCPAILPESPADVSPRGQRVMDMLQQYGLLGNLFGDPIDADLWKASNPLNMAETCDLKAGVDIYCDCGDQDSYGFDETCRAFDEVLKKRNIAHEFAIRSGGHSWEYVRSSFPHSLEFINKHLKAASTKSAPPAPPKKAEAGAASRGS